METKKTDSYIVFSAFAILAVIFASVATYDISYHFSPNEVRIFGFALTREVISTISIFVVDGLYILLDFMLKEFRTKSSRRAAGYFMVFLWCAMLALNLSSAVLNNQMDTNALGKFSIVVYAVKVVALLYLAFYTYIRYDDPETKRVMIEMESSEIRTAGINNYVKTFSNGFARGAAKLIAMEQMATYVEQQTGKHPSDMYGKNWQSVIAKMSGVNMEFDEEPEETPTTGKRLPTGNPALSATGKKEPKLPVAPKMTPPALHPAPTTGKTTGNPFVNWAREQGNRLVNLATGNSPTGNQEAKLPVAEANTTGNSPEEAKENFS